jgi:hypothetical protein
MYVLLQSHKKEENNLEQSYVIKFYNKLGEGSTDTYENIQEAFGNDSLSRAQVFRWFKEFVNDREMVEDEQGSGRPGP